MDLLLHPRSFIQLLKIAGRDNLIGLDARKDLYHVSFFLPDLHALVTPIGYSHLHLSYEDVTVGTCIINGHFGRLQPNGSCQQVTDFAQEPRFVNPHDKAGVISIKVTQAGVPVPFNFSAIEVTGDPLAYRFLKNGKWSKNATLNFGSWDLSSKKITGVTEVQISCPHPNGDTAGTCGFDNVQLDK